MHMSGQATVSQCSQQKKQAWVWDCALGSCAHSSRRQTLRFPEHPLPERIFNQPSCLSHEPDACSSFTSSTPSNGKCHMLSFRKDTYNLVANLQVVQNWCVRRMIQIKASSLGLTWLWVAPIPRSLVQTVWVKWRVSLFNLHLHKQMKLLTAEIIQSIWSDPSK